MRVGRKAFEMTAQALVHHLILGEPLAETFQLLFGGQSAPDHQPGGFDEGAVLGQLLDRDAAIAQDTLVAVDVGDGGLAGTGVAIPVVQGDVARAVAQRADVERQFVFGSLDGREIMKLSIQFDAARMAMAWAP